MVRKGRRLVAAAPGLLLGWPEGQESLAPRVCKPGDRRSVPRIKRGRWASFCPAMRSHSSI